MQTSPLLAPTELFFLFFSHAAKDLQLGDLKKMSSGQLAGTVFLYSGFCFYMGTLGLKCHLKIRFRQFNLNHQGDFLENFGINALAK